VTLVLLFCLHEVRMYTVSAIGTLGDRDFALYVHHQGERISTWHDIPLRHGEFFHFVCEIPKHTRQKMEIQKHLSFHPIMQDIVMGELRQYRYGDILCNYGAFPQTWEDPDYISPHTSARGDNDPLDVLEIGSTPLAMASVTPVKVLGVLGMIDNGETDWKVVAIRTTDPLADRLHDIEDIERERPRLLAHLREWLAHYKTADGGAASTFAFRGQYQGRAFALRIIQECHDKWSTLHLL
jgi:inorganic pyrophosphatase